MGGQGWTSLFSPDIADSRQMKRTGPGLSAFLRPWETLVQGRASGVLRSSGGKKLFRGRHWGPRDERQCPRERLAIAAVTPLNFSALALGCSLGVAVQSEQRSAEKISAGSRDEADEAAKS